MTAEYPGAVPTFPVIDAGSGDLLDTVGKEHDALHNKAADEIIALATALGINPITLSESSPPGELDTVASQAAFNDMVVSILKRILGTHWKSANLYSLTDIIAALDYTSNDVQRVQVPAGVTGGTFTVIFGGQQSAPIDWDSSAAAWDTALEAMSSIGSGNITPLLLAGGSGSPSHLQAQFVSAMAAKPWPTLLIDATGLTGPGAPYTIATNHITPGGTGHSHATSNPLGGGLITLAGEVTGDTAHTLVSKLMGKVVWSGWNDQGEAPVYFAGDNKLHAAQVATHPFTVVINNPVVGDVCDIFVPFYHDIVRWTLLADQAGDVEIEVWRDTYTNYPPTSGDKISASAPMTLSSAAKAQNTTLTGWNKTDVPDNRTYRFHINSVATITRLTINFDVRSTWF
jgi:hypothetical protein